MADVANDRIWRQKRPESSERVPGVTRSEAPTRFRKIAALVGIGILGSFVGGRALGEANQRDEIAAAEAEGQAKTEVALALGQAGFTTVVAIETLDDGSYGATLSADPSNAEACKITFAIDYAETTPRLVLEQTDASGRLFSQAVASDGPKADGLMADMCVD